MRWVGIIGAAIAALGMLTACNGDLDANNMCIFEPSEMIVATNSDEAERLFQQGRALDLSIITHQPETIPQSLRGMADDRVMAKGYYTRAAELGHTGAMNNLAVFLHRGLGADDSAPDYAAAYAWNVEMARRSDPKGYIGMAAYLFSGAVGPVNEPKAVACLVAGARLDDPRATQLLAQDDLGLRDLAAHPVRPPARVDRGITLLEQLYLRGHAAAYADLAQYYDLIAPDPVKFEYYARTGAAGGALRAKTALLGAYLNNRLGGETADQGACLDGLSADDMAQLETLCPRPDRMLTRALAGLPPVPDQLDIPAYLADFAAQNPDVVR